MSVTLGKSPVIMTAQGDTITGNWKVTTVRFVTGASSGIFILKDASSGRIIIQTRSLQANDSEESGALDYWIDGLYVDTIPSGAQVHVYYE